MATFCPSYVPIWVSVYVYTESGGIQLSLFVVGRDVIVDPAKSTYWGGSIRPATIQKFHCSSLHPRTDLGAHTNRDYHANLALSPDTNTYQLKS